MTLKDADDVIISAEDVTIDLGGGRDMLKYKKASSALIVGEPNTKTMKEIKVRVYFLEELESLESKIAADVNLALPGDVLSGQWSGSARFINSLDRNERTVYLVAYASCRLFEAYVPDDLFKFRPAADSLVNSKEWDKFHKAYGNYYLRAKQYGGYFYLHRQYKFTSEEEASTFQFEAEGRYGGSSLSRLTRLVSERTSDSFNVASWGLNESPPAESGEKFKRYMSEFMSMVDGKTICNYRLRPYTDVMPPDQQDSYNRFFKAPTAIVEQCTDWIEQYQDADGEAENLLSNDSDYDPIDDTDTTTLKHYQKDCSSFSETIRTQWSSWSSINEYQSPESMKEQEIISSSPADLRGNIEQLKQKYRKHPVQPLQHGDFVKMMLISPYYNHYIDKANEDHYNNYCPTHALLVDGKGATVLQVYGDNSKGKHALRNNENLRFYSTFETELGKKNIFRRTTSGFTASHIEYEETKNYKEEAFNFKAQKLNASKYLYSEDEIRLVPQSKTSQALCGWDSYDYLHTKDPGGECILKLIRVESED